MEPGAASLTWSGCEVYSRQPCRLSAAAAASTPLNHSRRLKNILAAILSDSSFAAILCARKATDVTTRPRPLDISDTPPPTPPPPMSDGNGMKGRTKLWVDV